MAVKLAPHVPKTASDEGVIDAAKKALGKMLALAGELAKKEGAVDGFRSIINTGRVGHQEVYHVHMHVIGGPQSLGPMILRQK